MTTRIDTASKVIHASAPAVYQAFAAPGAMERWLPPTGMTGTMLSFDFREGGSYRMQLKHENSENAPGKTTGDTDEVFVRINRLVADERIEQSVTFESDEPEFSGEMRITWSLTPVDSATLVEVRCNDVPEGISREDHQAGLNASLRNLAAFVKAGV